MTNASVIRFEQVVAKNDHEASCTELINILAEIDAQFGGFHTIECNYPEQLEFSNDEKAVHLCNRVATAATKLFDGSNAFGFSDAGFLRIMSLHRWLGIIFATSSYVNADHILRTYNITPSDNPNHIDLPPDVNVWRKFCVLYTLESNIPLNLDVLWKVSPELCGCLCFALQSPRFLGTEAAFNKRHAILKFFPEKVKQFSDLNPLPSGISHDVYMHCSYDIAADKHRVKEGLNQVMRRHLQAGGLTDRTNVNDIGKINGKPVMFVVLEHFHSAHSIYRTHSTSMIASREHFHLIGFGNTDVDVAGQAVFDEFISLEDQQVLTKIQHILAKAEEVKPAVLYMPSIGMDLTTIFLSNLRIAPVQAVALGHPGTTHSPFIDYVIVEDDYVGDEACFSEELIRLPKNALPYVPSALAPESVNYNLRENPEVVQIGIASTTMKLNPYFLKVCQAIKERSRVPVHFHFALGQSIGITHPYVTRFIKSYLGDSATAHSHRSYHQYLEVLHKCDLMINPFPFGNTNGIIDMVTLGLVGVCKTGPEVHEHIDEGLFGRLGLPLDKLVARTADDYVEKVLHLVENHEERLQLRRQIIENNGLQTLFTGNPKPMGERFMAKLQERGLLGADNASTTEQPVKKTAAKKTTAKKTTAKKTAAKTAKTSTKAKSSTVKKTTKAKTK